MRQDLLESNGYSLIVGSKPWRVRIGFNLSLIILFLKSLFETNTHRKRFRFQLAKAYYRDREAYFGLVVLANERRRREGS